MIVLNQKYWCNAKLSYMDTDSFIMHIKTEDIYEDIMDHVQKIFDTSNYGIVSPLPIGKNKVIWLMKDELDEKIMTEFVGLRPKTHCHLIDDGSGDKKAKGTRNVQ